MKRNSLLLLFICLFVINVKADMSPPAIVPHKVMVTNKNGAQCFQNGKKMDLIIPYGTTLDVFYDISGSYIYVTDGDNNKYNCDVKYSDVSSKTQSFNMNDAEVEKITPVRAIILPKGGINLRKGPSVTFSKITTVPQYSVVTLTHHAGTYWYYTNYNGNNGWLTSINYYLGLEDNKVLISPTPVKVYDTKTGKVIGTIPANTDITNYLKLVSEKIDEPNYYVIYNGIKGYIKEELYEKIDAIGKIKLTKDYELKDDNGNLSKKLTVGRELEFSMRKYQDDLYIPELKKDLYFTPDEFEYIINPKVLTKESGYLGEGLFGEEKIERTTPEPSNNESDPIDPSKETPDNGLSTRDIIVIALLGGIFLALTALVIIKLVNSKKKDKIKNMTITNNKSVTVNNNDKEV